MKRAIIPDDKAMKTLIIRVKDNKRKVLKQKAFEVNQVWNDANHKWSTKIVKENELIAIGNVSASKLAKTKMAKSVLDAGWYQLKNMLDYKSKAMRCMFVEVNESYTTQTCSTCQKITDTSPKGRSGLGIREWTCSGCGTRHDRDINAATNILRLGSQALVAGVCGNTEDTMGDHCANPPPNL